MSHRNRLELILPDRIDEHGKRGIEVRRDVLRKQARGVFELYQDMAGASY